MRRNTFLIATGAAILLAGPAMAATVGMTEGTKNGTYKAQGTTDTPHYFNVQNQGSFFDSWSGVEWSFDLGADAGKDIAIESFKFQLHESKVSWSNSGGIEIYMLADDFDVTASHSVFEWDTVATDAIKVGSFNFEKAGDYTEHNWDVTVEKAVADQFAKSVADGKLVLAFRGVYDEENMNGTALAAAGVDNKYDAGPSIGFDYSVAAVPEPASLALLGLGGLALLRRRK